MHLDTTKLMWPPQVAALAINAAPLVAIGPLVAIPGASFTAIVVLVVFAQRLPTPPPAVPAAAFAFFFAEPTSSRSWRQWPCLLPCFRRQMTSCCPFYSGACGPRSGRLGSGLGNDGGQRREGNRRISLRWPCGPPLRPLLRGRRCNRAGTRAITVSITWPALLAAATAVGLAAGALSPLVTTALRKAASAALRGRVMSCAAAFALSLAPWFA